MVGNGSDELIDIITRKYGKRVLIPTPTFGEFEHAAKRCGSRIMLKECMKNGSYQVSFSENDIKTATLIWLCNPNNPTANKISKETIRNILRNTNGIVVVDENYFEFCGDTVIDQIKHFKNLIVLRSFSKYWELAGLRIGFLAANKKLVEELESLKQPYNVNCVAEMAVKYVYRLNKHYIKLHKKTVARRKKYTKLIRKLGLKVLESDTNFILVGFESRKKSLECVKYLKSNGVLTLHISDKEFTTSDVNSYIRICIGEKYEMNKLVKLLWKFLKDL